MKRFFILASAAIVALASCAKTEVVYNDAPEQIAFKQITGAMTKATTTPLEGGHLGVFAEMDGEVYFGNTYFGWVGSSYANSGKYWPYDGDLDFTVYYPYVDGAEYAGNVLTIPGVIADEALYYGSQRYVDTEKGTGTVSVVLQHVSAMIQVQDGITGDLYTLKSVVLADAPTSGDVTVTYDANGLNPAVATKTGFTKSSKTCIETEVVDETPTLKYSDVYVLPNQQTKFTVTFVQKAGGAEYVKDVPLSTTWDANKKYIYTLGVAGADHIYFTASVEEFSTVISTPTVN